MKSLSVVLYLTAAMSLHAQAPGKVVPLVYNAKPISAVFAGGSTFPSEFVGTYVCEDGEPTPTATAAGIRLNADGTGLYETDAAFGTKKLPSASVRWYVWSDEAGKLSSGPRGDSIAYFVIVEFSSPYYNFKAGDLYGFLVTKGTGANRRLSMDTTKYRDY